MEYTYMKGDTVPLKCRSTARHAINLPVRIRFLYIKPNFTLKRKGLLSILHILMILLQL